jgi:BppU N-terminal domain
MQFNPSYLYPNKVDVFSNLGSWQIERYRKVYQRTIKAYRGVDNRIDFQVRNSDQKSQNITGSTVVFNMFTQNTQELVISRECTIVDAASGKIFVNLTENDLQSLSFGFYNYSLYTVSSLGIKTPLYGDSQFGAIGQLEVIANVYGEVVPTEVITTFNVIDNYRVSSAIDARPELNSNSALHSFAFYGTNYSGTVVIQGSLDENSTGENWIDLETISLSNSTINYKNVNGIWSWFRIKHTPVAGTVDKVLYRY